MQLIDELEFDPVDVGSLDESWRQQPGTPVYTTDLDADGVRRALSQASPERTAQRAPRPPAPVASATHRNRSGRFRRASASSVGWARSRRCYGSDRR
jgi:hypothetical protein